MATTTTRLSLRKPAGTDLVTVGTDLNANYDILDNALVNGVTNTFVAGNIAQYFVNLTNNGASGKHLPALRLASDILSTLDASVAQLALRHMGYVSAEAFIGMDSGGNLNFSWDFGGGPAVRVQMGPGIGPKALGQAQLGDGALGGASGFTVVGDDGAGGARVMGGHGTVADAPLSLRPKGISPVYIQDGAGSELAHFNHRGLTGNLFTALIVFWKDAVGATNLSAIQVGAAGTGPGGSGRALFL